MSGVEQALLQGCQWLQSTDVATSIRESGYLYPAIEGTHVLALAVSVGTVMWFDLRLAGLVWKKSPVSQVFQQLLPTMLVGFGLMFATGALLFSARAPEAFASVYFRIKMALLLLGGLNILLFHFTIDRRRAEWDLSQPPPLQARIAGMVSLVLWFAVIAAGRIMAYNL